MTKRMLEIMPMVFLQVGVIVDIVAVGGVAWNYTGWGQRLEGGHCKRIMMYTLVYL